MSASSSSSAAFAATSAPRSQRYLTFMRWLRRVHGWLGLWGALLGLVFGFSGIWLNHRAVLKLPVAQQRTNAQLALAEPAPASAAEMAAWLQATLNLDAPPNAVRVEPSRPVAWGDKGQDGAPSVLRQPERWVFGFGGPQVSVQAEYWVGNRSVGVTTTRSGFVATLTNLHKGNGMPVGWILLVDTLAGSLIFLSISGVLLWMQTNRRRVVGVAIFSASAASAVGLLASRL